MLVAAGTWAYSTSFAGVFVFDDTRSIVENPNIRSLWPLTSAAWAPKDTTVSGRPVASLSLALNYTLAPAEVRAVMTPADRTGPPDTAARFLRNVWGYHAFNLAAHLLAALALFGVVRRSLRADRLRAMYGAHSTVLAAVIALVWVVHPLHTQAVTYIVQRVESMMGLFYLLTLYCAIRAREEGARRAWWTAASVAACALGMGTKETMVTAPLAVWLWDLTLGGPQHQAGRRSLYGGLAATWLILAALIASGARPGSVGFGFGEWTWWTYLRTQAGVILYYLRLAVYPSSLVLDYDWPQAQALAEYVPQIAVLSVAVALTGIALVRRWSIGLLGAWFFLILAPSSSVLPIPTEVAAPHRMYLPLAAPIALAVLGIYQLARRWLAQRGPTAIRACALTGLAAAAAASLALAVATHQRNRLFWSSEILMRDVVQKRPLNARARIALGAELLQAGRFAEAEAEMRLTVPLKTTRPVAAHAHMYLGSALCAQGKIEEGIGYLEHAMAIDPSLTDVHALLGEAYAAQGNFAAAAGHLAKAVEATPDNPFILTRAAWLYATAPQAGVRNGARAIDLAQRAVGLTGGSDPVPLDTLSAAYAEAGHFAEAQVTSRRAIAAARARRQTSLVPVLRQHLDLFMAGRAVRDPAR